MSIRQQGCSTLEVTSSMDDQSPSKCLMTLNNAPFVCEGGYESASISGDQIFMTSLEKLPGGGFQSLGKDQTWFLVQDGITAQETTNPGGGSYPSYSTTGWQRVGD